MCERAASRTDWCLANGHNAHRPVRMGRDKISIPCSCSSEGASEKELAVRSVRFGINVGQAYISIARQVHLNTHVLRGEVRKK